MPASLTAVARHFDFVRETEGPNRGAWVSFFLRGTGNVEGESWCASFVSRVGDIAYKGRCPMLKTASTVAMLDSARTKGWIVTAPQPDDLYFFVHDDGTPHHVGIVTSVNPLLGIAGNTSSDGTSSDGTGVFEHAIASGPHTLFVRLPIASIK